MDATAHPDCTPRSMTAVYNCLGMVFASRRTWVEGHSDEHTERVIQMIISDDEYRRLSHDEEPMIGDLVLYRDTDESFTHIGIIAQVRTNLAAATFDIEVLSKWGAHGEYFHAEDDVYPAMGKPVAYYTGRK